VEAAGVEPASENALELASTRVGTPIRSRARRRRPACGRDESAMSRPPGADDPGGPVWLWRCSAATDGSCGHRRHLGL